MILSRPVILVFALFLACPSHCQLSTVQSFAIPSITTHNRQQQPRKLLKRPSTTIRSQSLPWKPALFTSTARFSAPASKNDNDSVKKMTVEALSVPLWRDLAGVAVWIVPISAFVLQNNFVGPWPETLLYSLSVRQWALLHAISGMLFSGTILVSTFIEWIVVNNAIATAKSKDKNDQKVTTNILKFWFATVPQLDANIVLPALSLAMLSGVSQAAYNYGTLANSPIHVRGIFHALLTFMVWWASTDFTTQRKTKELVLSLNDGEGLVSPSGQVPSVVWMRRISNIVSCIFVAALYAVMVLKPGI